MPEANEKLTEDYIPPDTLVSKARQDPRILDDSFKNELSEENIQQQRKEGEEEIDEQVRAEAELQEIEENEEEEAMNELASEQEAYLLQKQLEQLLQEGQSFGHPSYFKYFVILIPWAVIVDIVDVLDLTGIGAIIGRAFSIFSWLCIIFILWFTDQKYKRSQNYAEGLEDRIAQINQDLARVTKYSLKGSRYLRRVPGMKGIARKIPRALVKIRRFIRKNPITKVLIGGAINIVPWISVFNLLFVWVYFSYRDEKKGYEHASEISKEALGSIE